MEISIDSLEEMCALMCDNRIPTKKKQEIEEDETDKEEGTDTPPVE